MTAVITDVHYRMSLALIRDLAEAGIRVVVCENSNSQLPLGFYSRYIDQSHLFCSNEYLSELYSLCKSIADTEGEKPALLPVGADTIAALADKSISEKFSTVCGLAVPEKETLDLFNDKSSAWKLASELDIPVPATCLPGESVSEFISSISFPCVVKPVCGEKLGLTAAARYIIAKDFAELEYAYNHFLSLGGEPIVQQYLSGSGIGCSVVSDCGKIVSSICHRRIREYPIDGGPSSCCEAFRSPLLESYAAKLVSHTRFTGLAMFEFKED